MLRWPVVSRSLPRTDDRSEELTLDSGLEALRSSPEFRGPVESLDGHHCNDHFAHIYETSEEKFEAAVPFVRHGLERGERCMYVVDESAEAEVKAALRDGDVDVDAALEAGALSFHTVQETYLQNGAFDVDDMIDFYGDTVAEATGEEYTALRVVAEMSWVCDDDTSVEQVMEYEQRINELFTETDSLAICQYNRELFAPAIIRDVVQTHPHLIYDGTACHNFYYTPPEEFFNADAPARENDRMLRTLRDRAAAKAEIQERERSQRDLYEITASSQLSFDEKVRRLLELGRERFGFDIGLMLRREGERLRIQRASGTPDVIEEGETTVRPLPGQYCNETMARNKPLAVTDAEAAGWDDDPLYREYGLKCYLGVKITDGSGAYGTLCFSESAPRDEPITDAERTFLELMGQWISYELERRRRERFLRESYEVTSDPALSFEEKLERLLDLGRERFGLGIGALTREHEHSFEIEKMRGSHPELDEGTLTPPMTENYCRRVVDTGETVSVADAGAAGWDEDALYRKFNLQCYAGVQVNVGDDVYGTVFFTDLSPRETEFTGAERAFLELIGQWASYELEREQREDRLAALNVLSRDLMETETAADVSECVVDSAEDTLRMPVTAIALYDGREGVLRPADRTDEAAGLLEATSPFDAGENVGWKAFVEGEDLREADPLADGTADIHPPITEMAAFPLGSHGVLLAGSTSTDGFRPAEINFAETVAANAKSALDRADREQQLQERERTLEEQNETLERLDRINDIIRRIDQGLVEASTRNEIDEVVCEQLAGVGPYELAWIGERSAATGEVLAREWAGSDRGYVEQTTSTAGDASGDLDPIGEAVRTGEAQVVENVLTDASAEPWRQAALNRGYHSCLALPLTYDDSRYGVLAVYAGQPGVFDELERAVLSELSDTIAYAINAVESKKALVGEKVTELEFDVRERLAVLDLAVEVGCRVTLESCIPLTDGSLRVFFSTRGAPAAEILEFASDLPAREVALVTEYDSDDETVALFEASVTGESLCATVLDHGGVVRHLDVPDGRATVGIELPADANVRDFVELFRTKYPKSELTAQRTRQRERRTLTEFSARIREELTARQLEVLETAYYSGFFEKPRPRNGSEIAESLGITQPTFNHHLRASHRKLCRMLFEENHPRKAST